MWLGYAVRSLCLGVTLRCLVLSTCRVLVVGLLKGDSAIDVDLVFIRSLWWGGPGRAETPPMLLVSAMPTSKPLRLSELLRKGLRPPDLATICKQVAAIDFIMVLH